MRLAKLEEGLTNRKLAVSIQSSEGSKLISEGTILSDRLIEKLADNGIHAVYIEDENCDIQFQETLDICKYDNISRKLKEIYNGIEKNEFSVVNVLRFIRSELLPKIKNEPVSIPANQVMNKDDLIQHSLNAAFLSARMAYLMGLNMEKIELMVLIALMHDIGKIIHKKEGNKNRLPHYESACEFLKRKNCTVLTYMSIRFQNEAFDGRGLYRITEDKQIIFAKILSICDYYETLLRSTNLMPYECFEKTQSQVYKKFDPRIFEVFRDSIYIYPVGLPVLFNIIL